jgi:valyl-tRNA synthetase
VSATLLWVLERLLGLLHPIMPFVTEEIWSYHPSRHGHLAVHAFPEPDGSLRDAKAEAEVREGIELTGRLRAWRDLVEAPAATVLPARAEGIEPQEFVGRLARFEFGEDGGDPVAAVGPVKILASAAIDAEAVAARLEARREELRSEVSRAEGKLGNEKFVDRAPAEVVEEEREKLERYRAELQELSE